MRVDMSSLEVRKFDWDFEPISAAAELPNVEFQADWTEAKFRAAVRRAKAYIAAGDVYQINLSHRFESAWPCGANGWPFYLALRECSPAPYGAFFDLGGRQVISSSPECFLSLSGSHISTRPIKGTRPRRRDPDEDERSAYELITSPKEIAELVMITDLLRNDLGRVCQYGSIQVPDLARLERFPQVQHLVSGKLYDLCVGQVPIGHLLTAVAMTAPLISVVAAQ